MPAVMAAVPQIASILPQSMARPGVNSGIKRKPWTTLSSTEALAIFCALLNSQPVGCLTGVWANRLPSAMEKMDAPSEVHLQGARFVINSIFSNCMTTYRLLRLWPRLSTCLIMLQTLQKSTCAAVSYSLRYLPAYMWRTTSRICPYWKLPVCSLQTVQHGPCSLLCHLK